jgi:hypothetical protein
MPGKTIRIISDRERGSSPVRINGIGRELPHNREVAVTEDELALLENSNLAYEVLGNAGRAEIKAAEAEAGDKPAGVSPQPAGGDFLPTRDPAEDSAAAAQAPKIDQEAGGDNLAGSVAHGAAAGLLADEEARSEAADKAAAARDGTIAPVVELRNSDPDQLGLDAGNPDLAAAEQDPLDHDGDGRKGGSKPRRAKAGSVA